ncbi:MAG TPA: LLM class flavin-dependent oxidoreductase [Candidatus Binataceae bacterium]|jgi:alkanesulfonate monooxygenase SsuD/methylene tetrahydromethanopterin reductase-like flavin-dependent oxidoreductase (luciferase family)
MASPVSFGFTIPQRGVLFGVATWPQMIALAREADRIALFDSLWVGDSVMAKPRPDSISLLGALSAATTRVRLGVGCMASFPIRDPIVFALQWATLDLISGGRMVLVVCTGIVAGGVSAREGSAWGIKDTARGNRMAENIEICRRLWSEDRVSFQGKYHSFNDVTVTPRPIQQPCPIWIAANPQPHEAEKPLRRVVRIADGWMSANAFPGLFAANWEKLAGHLKEAGKDPATYPTIAYHNININPDRDAALQESKRFLDEYYGPVFAPPMVEGWTAAGTPKQCAEDLRAIARAGAKTITLRITSWDQAGQFQRLVHEVLPLVNQ